MGPTTEALRGSHENTDIGDFITAYLDLDLDDITERLNK
jgi:alkaline phosphatase